MTSISFFKYSDVFELDVNVVNFVYYGKTRLLYMNTTHGSAASFAQWSFQFLSLLTMKTKEQKQIF